MNEHVLLSCHLLDAVMCWLLMLQWSPNNRLLLFGTSDGEVLIHDSAGELIVSVVYAFPFTKSAYYCYKGAIKGLIALTAWGDELD